MNFTWKIDDDLSLRLLEPRHAEEVYALIDRNRDHLRPWFRWAPNVDSAKAVGEKIASWLHDLAERGSVFTMIEAHGRPVGLMYTCDRDVVNKRVELGYWLDHTGQGKGYVTRACRALIDYAFDVLGVNRIDITADIENTRSRAVAERLGFTHEADIAKWLCFPDGQCRDMASYRLLREDWERGTDECAGTA